jgi:DNA invertase Pin-like site-specific DNA recombinase
MSYKRVALYARTSTVDKQNPEVQLRELREYAKHRDWEVAGVYEDRGYTGTNSNRPMLKQVLQDAKRRRFDIVLVWKLDRWGRSLREIVLMLQELAEHRVEFCSLKDALDLSTSQGRLMMHLLAAFAQFEADVIKTRVLAGLEHAKACGKRLGRPKLHDDESIRKLRTEGLSYRAIQKRLGVPMGCISRALAPAPKSLPETIVATRRKTRG